MMENGKIYAEEKMLNNKVVMITGGTDLWDIN